MGSEFAAATAHQDEYGWNELDWLHYIHSRKAGEHAIDVAQLAQGDSSPVPPLPDAAHEAKSVEGFATHPAALLAGLDRAQVLALRLYSSGALAFVNQQLRVGCTQERPHSYPALVLQLNEALKKIRTAAVAPRADRAAKAAAKVAAAKAAAEKAALEDCAEERAKSSEGTAATMTVARQKEAP